MVVISVGVDVGSKFSGIFNVEYKDEVLMSSHSEIINTSRVKSIDERVFLQECRIINYINTLKNIDIIVIEYPFSIKGHARVLLEIIGALKYYANIKKTKYLMVPQKTLKIFATGKGNADKTEIVLRAYKEFNMELTSDEADALYLAFFGIYYLKGLESNYGKLSFRNKCIEKYIASIGN